LDDVKKMEKVDKSKMRKLLFEFASQCKEGVKLGENLPISEGLFQNKDKLMICGLGGSAIGGDVLRTLLSHQMKIPIFVNRNYDLPQLVDERTLVFVVSYSGNTEETIASYKEAKRRNSAIISVSSGGRLRKLSEEDGIPHITIPSGMPPRTALGYLFLPILRVLENIGWAPEQDYDELFRVLQDIRDRCAPDTPMSINLAKAIASELVDRIPLIYGVDGKTDVAAHRLKTQFNENSKVLAFWDVFPELNHNEVVPWGEEGKASFGQFYPIFIRDKGETERIKRRIEVTQSIIEKRGVKWREIWTEGENLLTRILSVIYIGDWISFYLAIIGGVDPTPVRAIDFLKKELSRL